MHGTQSTYLCFAIVNQETGTHRSEANIMAMAITMTGSVPMPRKWSLEEGTLGKKMGFPNSFGRRPLCCTSILRTCSWGTCSCDLNPVWKVVGWLTSRWTIEVNHSTTFQISAFAERRSQPRWLPKIWGGWWSLRRSSGCYFGGLPSPPVCQCSRKVQLTCRANCTVPYKKKLYGSITPACTISLLILDRQGPSRSTPPSEATVCKNAPVLQLGGSWGLKNMLSTLTWSKFGQIVLFV